MQDWHFDRPPNESMAASFGRLFAALLIAAVAAFCIAAPAFASEDRVALVIGNDAYPTEPLKNAVNDAQQVARTLSELGFKVVFKTNADFTTMRAAAVEFANLLDNNYAAVFYFAGHGIQYRGKNYLVPIDAKLSSETEVVFNALEVTQILERMQDGNVRHKFLILDACRNNPFRAVFGSNATQGLAKMQTPPGTTIAFAAQAGAVAEDGKGENGVYTKSLLRELKKPDIQAALMFQQVSQAVQLETMGRQTPEVQSVAASKGLFFFNDSRLSNANPGDAKVVLTAKPDASRPSADTETKVDLEFWSTVKDSSRIDDIQAYLDQFPKGRFAVLARNRIDALKRAQVAAKPVIAEPRKPAAEPKPEAAPGKQSVEPKPEPLPQLAESRGIEVKPAPTPAPVAVVAVETPIVTNTDVKEAASNPPPAELVAAIAPKPQAPEPAPKPEAVDSTEGVITFTGGARYAGHYKEIKGKEKVLHGKGEYSTRDFTYIGEFKDGKKHGRGLYRWTNGDSFEGDFAEDLPNGKGKYRFASGDEYEGDIVAGRINGQGVYITHAKDRIEGQFADAKANGRAVYLFANGDKYEGEMTGGRLSGKGVYTTKGHDRIEAVFRDGKAEGEGVCYFANNDRYEGEMKGGALTGKGKYFYSNGLRSEGDFVDGRLKGKGTFYFNDGSRFEGEFEDGLKSAKGFSYSKDGTKQEAVIVDNAVKITGG